MLTFIKQELFLLGLISMLLTAVQDSMLRICIPNSAASYGLHWYPEPVGEEAGYGEKSYKGLRRLLGGPPKSEYNYCEEGKQPLFSAYMIYQVHLFIFLLAVIHVLYVAGTVLVCLFQMRQWHHWEAEAPASDAFLRITGAATTPRHGGSSGTWTQQERVLRRSRADAKAMWHRVGTTKFTHGLRVALAVVTTDLVFSPINRAVYYSLRLTFIHRLGLDRSFDFANFIERSIEEQIPYLMKLNAAMMCLAAALLSFPFPAYLPYWLFGLGVIVEIILAGKLASVTTLLAGQALAQFGDGSQFFGRAEPDPEDLIEVKVDGGAAAAAAAQTSAWLQGNPFSRISGKNPFSRPSAGTSAAAAVTATAAGGAAAAGGGGVANPFSRPSGNPFSRLSGNPFSRLSGGLFGGGGSKQQQQEPRAPEIEEPPLRPALRPVRTKPVEPGAAAAAAPTAAAAGQLDARAITRRIETCTDLQQLEDFVAENGAAFNQIHVSLALLQLHRIAEISKKQGLEKKGSGQQPQEQGDAEAAAEEGEGEACERQQQDEGGRDDLGQSDQPKGSREAGAGEDYDKWKAERPSPARRQNSQATWDELQREADQLAQGGGGADDDGGDDTAQDRDELAPGGRPAVAAGDGGAFDEGSGGVHSGDVKIHVGGEHHVLVAPCHEAAPGLVKDECPDAPVAGLARKSSFLPAGSSLPSHSPSASSVAVHSKRHQKVVERVSALPHDASKLFLFGRPRLLLLAFQFVFYSNAFLLTLASFAFWQKHATDWMYQGVGILPTILLMIGSVLLAVHSALRVLPSFALLEPIGRHSPSAVLRRALKEGGLQPEQAAALASQLGVDLPNKEATEKPRRSLTWKRLSSSLLDRPGQPEQEGARARRVLRKLMSLRPRKAKVQYDEEEEEAVVAPNPMTRPSAGSRRSLEELKSASMADLLGFLAAATDGQPAPAAAQQQQAPALPLPLPNPMARGSLAASSDAGGAAGSEGGLKRSRSTPNLDGALTPHGSGAHGHSNEPSSNVELAGEMLRALVLRQARAGSQPLTPGDAAAAAVPQNSFARGSLPGGSSGRKDA